MLSNPDFNEGMGMDIHVRTKPRYEYSYIEAAAIRIGNDVLEVGSWGDYFFNGVNGGDLPAVMGGKYSVKHVPINKKNHEFIITITEAVEETILVKSYKDLVSVTFKNATFTNFANSQGLMGNYVTGDRLSRNGILLNDDTHFGQVRRQKHLVHASKACVLTNLL